MVSLPPPAAPPPPMFPRLGVRPRGDPRPRPRRRVPPPRPPPRRRAPRGGDNLLQRGVRGLPDVPERRPPPLPRPRGGRTRPREGLHPRPLCPRLERILVFQDSMGAVVAYRAWAFAGMPQMYPIDTSLAVYVAWYEANVGGPDPGGPSPALPPLGPPTGTLAAPDPRAFAVLLFFVSFLYAVRAPRAEVLRMGGIYAYAVFLVYFLIGLGIP